MRIPVVLVLSASLWISASLADGIGNAKAQPDHDAAAGQSVAHRFTPARFAAGLDAASASIRFPNHKRDLSLYLHCAARISTTGAVLRHFCLDYYGSGDSKFRRAAEAFIESATFSPAMVDGRPVAVEFYFRIFFGRRGTQYAAAVLPNWGDDVDKYDIDYEGPQRYDKVAAQPACNSIGGISRVLVDTDGHASGEVALVMSYGVPEHFSVCETLFTDVVRNGSYIPAHKNGKPVPATYAEVGGDPSWFELKKPEGL